MTSLSGLLHDIGKFYQRTGISVNLDKYIKYLVYRNNKLTYWHAAYSGLFIEKYLINNKKLISMCASHHKEATIIRKADRLAAAHDRRDSEYDNIFGVTNKIDNDFITTRLYLIFNEIKIKNINIPYQVPLSCNNEYKYPVRETTIDLDEALSQYSNLFTKFIIDIEKINKKNINSLYHYLYPILLNYLITIPANTYQTLMPTVSLFDHSKLTAAIANCLNDSNKDFIILKYHLHGISEFVYQGDFKFFKARSFYIQIINELITYAIINRFSLGYENIIYSLGGQGRILLPNNKNSIKILKKINSEINKEINLTHKGIINFVLSYDIYSEEDIKAGRFYHNLNKDEKHILKEKNNIKNYLEKKIKYDMIEKLMSKSDIILEYSFSNNNENILLDFNSLGKICYFEKIHNNAFYQSYNCYKIGDVKYFPYSKPIILGNKRLALILMNIKNLGIIFASGIDKNAQSISKLLTLSRCLERFFAYEVKKILEKFSVYILYSGSDDIVLISNPDDSEMIVKTIQESFARYTGYNKSFQFNHVIMVFFKEELRTVYYKAKRKLKRR